MIDIYCHGEYNIYRYILSIGVLLLGAKMVEDLDGEGFAPRNDVVIRVTLRQICISESGPLCSEWLACLVICHNK